MLRARLRLCAVEIRYGTSQNGSGYAFCQSITKDDYDKKLQKLKDEQYRIGIELEEYTKADHEYHIHVSTVLNLSRRVGEIFEGSELMEKRAILNFLLQNPVVNGRKLEFSLRKPFDVVLELGQHPTLLAKWDAIGTLIPKILYVDIKA